MKNCGRYHLFPCNFFYEKGKKCFKSADRCEFSHQFEAPGLRNHAKIHQLDLSKYELPAPPASPGREIIQPIIQVIDCRDCGKAHAPDKCRKKRASFSGHVRVVDRGSAGDDIGRYDALIRNESAEHSD